MIRSLPLVRRTLFLSVCGLFLFSGRLFAGNPLLMPSEAPYGAPRFDRIHAADIMPAIEEGIRAYKAGIAKIRALDPAEATFENVVVPLDRADSLLDVPRAVLGYLKSNFGGDSVIRISLESAQLTGEAYDAVTLDTAIFRLVKAVYDVEKVKPTEQIMMQLYPEIYSCVGCNACTKSCSQGLNVMQYIAYAQRGEFDKCAEESFDCVMCGVCSSRCPAGISHPQVAMLARRLNGKYIAPHCEHLDARVQEVKDGKFEALIESLMEKPLDAIKELYNHREIEK